MSKTLGQVGFDAYGDHAGWKAFDDRPMPRWDDNLRADIKEKWKVAADAIVEETAARCAGRVATSVLHDLVVSVPEMHDVWNKLSDENRMKILATCASNVRTEIAVTKGIK